MGSGDIEQWAREFYPVFDRQGLIIDVRHNSGGNIDSWLLGKLLRKAWFYWQPRVGNPTPTCNTLFAGTLWCSATDRPPPTARPLPKASGGWDGQGYRRAHLGRRDLAFRRAIRWQTTGLPPPRRRVYGPEGKWLIEGHGVDPDIVVDDLPHATFGGSDAQLDAAIKYLQEEIRKIRGRCRRLRRIPIRRFRTNRRDFWIFLCGRS